MRLNLICLPHAGAAAGVYRPWSALLPDWIRVVPLQLPGRAAEIMTAPLTDWSAVGDLLLARARPATNQPFALFGHSLGSLLALTLARRLTAEGRPPLWLGVSGSVAPRHREREGQWLSCSDQEMVAELIRLGGTPPEALANQELLSLLLPMLRADFHLAGSFPATPAPPLPCPLTAFTGTADPRCRDLAQVGDWAEETTGRFDQITLPGDHFFLNQDLRHFTGLITQALSRAMAV